MAPRGETSDENARIRAMPLHSDTIAKDGTTGKGACGVHSNNAKGFVGSSVSLDHLIDQGAFAHSRKATDSDHIGFSGMGIEGFQDFSGRWHAVINIPDQHGGSSDVTIQDPFDAFHRTTLF
jgi:hypothetical protein